MDRRCPGAELVDIARLDAHRFIINERGVATLVADARRIVYGVLYEVTPDHIAALDRHEGVNGGYYRAATVAVECLATKGVIEARTYIDHRHHPAPPRPGYLEVVLAGARAAGLPADYVAQLEGWLAERA